MKDICNQEKFFSTKENRANYYAEKVMLSLLAQGMLSTQAYRASVEEIRKELQLND